MMRGGTPATAIATTRALGVRPFLDAASSEAINRAHAPSLTPEAFPAGVSRCNRPVFPEKSPQLAELFNGGPWARMLVCVDHKRVLLAPRNLHRGDFFGEGAVLHRRRRLGLAPRGKEILVFTRDLELLGDVFGGLRHGVDAVLIFNDSVDESPADGGVEDLGVAAECGGRLAHHEGRTRHGLHAAGDQQILLV